MSLEKIEQAYLRTGTSPEEIEDMLGEELEEMLEDLRKEKVREEISGLESSEFRELAFSVLEQF